MPQGTDRAAKKVQRRLDKERDHRCGGEDGAAAALQTSALLLLDPPDLKALLL